MRLLTMLLLVWAVLTAAVSTWTNRQPQQVTPFRQGKDFALFFAVNDYEYWSKLKNPINELEKIAAELSQEYEFDTLILRNPSLEQIITTLRTYSAKTYPDDGQLLIYFSGHGDFDDLTREGFFIPREGKANDVAQNSYLSFGRLQRIVENIPCRHILLAIDACYSGTFDQLVATKGTPKFGRPVAMDERSRYIQNAMTLQSRFFLASGQKEQTPDISGFAAHFLQGLRNGGQYPGILTMDELWGELKKANPTPHFSNFIGHQDESDFLFIKPSHIPSKVSLSTSPASPFPSNPSSSKPEQAPCVTNQTGDVCVENKRNSDVWVNINNQIRKIPPGAKECFFDVPVGTLTFGATNYSPGSGHYILGGNSTHQARITACSMATTFIQ